jgi:hypothetical protein
MEKIERGAQRNAGHYAQIRDTRPAIFINAPLSRSEQADVRTDKTKTILPSEPHIPGE